MTTQPRIAIVAPLRRLPRNQSGFDYLAPQAVSVGDLVRIPFGRSRVYGVVVAVPSHTNQSKLKSIETVITHAYLSPLQLDLAQWVSHQYAISLSSAFLLFARPGATPYSGKVLGKATKLRLGSTKKPVVIAYGSLARRRELLIELVQRSITGARQVAIIVPEQYDLSWVSQSLQTLTPTLFSSNQPLAQQRAAWEAVRLGEARVVVGTRAACFLPFVNLGGIIIDGAEREHLKQWDQTPRYDATEVARQLAQAAEVPLALLSPAPRLEHWELTHHGEAVWRELVHTGPSCSCIHLVGGTTKHGLLSPQAVDAIGSVLRTGASVFLYLNRLGTATSMVCRECGFRPTCVSCGRNYVWSQQEHLLRCYHCGTQSLVPIPCPRCGGTHLQHLGAGVAALVREAATYWPRVPTAVVTAEDKVEVGSLPKVQLIIGSRAALPILPYPKLKLSVLVLPDAELGLPEFRSAERCWALGRHLMACGSSLVVQTFQPEHYVWQSLLRNQTQVFYESELKERERYSYPPAVALLRFTAQAKTETMSLAMAQDILAAVKPHLPPHAEVLGPYPDYYRQLRGRYRHHVLVKYPPAWDPAKLWPVLAPEVIVDRNPWSTLS